MQEERTHLGTARPSMTESRAPCVDASLRQTAFESTKMPARRPKSLARNSTWLLHVWMQRLCNLPVIVGRAEESAEQGRVERELLLQVQAVGTRKH